VDQYNPVPHASQKTGQPGENSRNAEKQRLAVLLRRIFDEKSA